MGKILKIYGPGDVRYDEYEERELKPYEVRLRTLFSGISAGTELTHYRGTNPYRHNKWDESKRIFSESMNDGYYPRATGYEEVGEVMETGKDVARVNKGDVIFGAWTHKSSHIMDEETAVKNRLLPELEPIQGIFAQIGAIAYNGILDTRINVGETITIFGQGTPGLICTQLAKLSGARVIAVDLYDERLEWAKKMGADIIMNSEKEKVGEAIKEITRGIGADACIEVSGSVSALGEAVKACAYSGKVTALGFYQGGADELFLGEEFHHNRISITCSQIGGVNPDLIYRWNNNRLYATIMEMQKDNRLRLKELITHKAGFEKAYDLYRLIDKSPSEVLQAVLCF